MRIFNEEQLVENGRIESLRRLRKDALDILKAALEAVEPKKAVFSKLKLVDDALIFDGERIDLGGFFRVFVVGGGKASGAMAEAVEEILGDRITGGLVSVLRGTEKAHRLRRIRLSGARHPIPDDRAVLGMKEMLSMIDEAREDDLVIVLLSGGGSALLTCPADGIGLEELKELTAMLLRCGATINELNAVRKHLSAIKGGQLVRRAHPATILSLILSDVVGDPLDVIASGPTSPDRSTFSESCEILQRYGLWEKAPESIRLRIEAGMRRDLGETPKPGDPIFEKVRNLIVGSNYTAAHAAKEKAESLGYDTLLLSTRIEGEARHVGTFYAGVANEALTTGNPVQVPGAIIAGGETTVKVVGRGRGGRNLELALSASMKIESNDIVIAALATDGIDGPTDAAGAVVDGETIKRAKSLGLSPWDFLLNNDSYGFFSKLGDTIMTGPTGTNVNDLAVVLVGG